ncbi:putative Ig domain-containing protein [Paenibacillus sp. sptzw28]|uniref:LamG-like jellyroll fold domain-containing protein n=1 Tax=Paenibacillus sp. sptzw28 TaxID=715179 RepID=UPI001C6EE80C|nr:LamG-like jellyroll fold domain-containing protein [Paenibacillus sp. sptzw28]QYR22772.1 putative Ig domain-containing protein [Paenibacillus sp. sptzw28]
MNGEWNAGNEGSVIAKDKGGQKLMQSSGGVFKRVKKMQRQAGRVLIIFLIAALILPVFGPVPGTVVHAAEELSTDAFLDNINFGNAVSESAHNFRGDITSVITGFMGEPARVSNPRFPVEGQGGDLTFTMKVDPNLRNYFTVKFSGEEDSKGYLSTVMINGEKVGVDHGDYDALNKGGSLPNRFYYNTIMLPLESTIGKNMVEITIKTIHVGGNMNSASRGYYNAYTHTAAYINVDGEQQGYKFMPDQNPDTMLAPDLTNAEKQATIDAYVQDQINLFNSLSNKVDGSAGGKMSIIRYQDELMFYASVLKYDWSPAKTPEEKQVALQRIFKTIDNHVKDYYGNTRLVLRGGHQGDWGGYYGALGEALYIVENLIKDDTIYGETAWGAFLDQPFVTGTVEGEFSLAGADWNGGELTRREAWERVLKANFDFARTRLSYIYNQVYYTYVGAWEAHEGLRLIGSSFYEGKERSNQILLESLGIRPFLGEEVLVGPSGEELDLYHSLFYHDGAAQFTDDFVHIVGKGLAKSKLNADGNVVRRLPYGEHYTGLTEAGLSRENGYVANYGEAANYLVTYFYKTLNHAGDEEMNDEILKAALKSIHARGFVRIPSLDGSGRRVMRAEQATDERNQNLPGFIAYGAGVGRGMGLQFASLEMTMAKNEQRYNGPEWGEYWQHAREAVGYVQQQLADRQLLQTKDFGSRGTMSGPDFRLAETYKYITSDRANYSRFGGKALAEVVLPHTDFDAYKPEEIAARGVNPDDYEQFAWADIDNMYVSVRDADFRMLGSLFYRNRGMTSNGRLHIIKDNYDHIVQIATNNVFRYEDYYLRAPNMEVDIYSDRGTIWNGVPQALAGEVSPVSYQPGVGTVKRDNFEVDNPYSGYPELLTSRYGKYFMIFNTTRDDFGNKKTFDVELPADFSGSTVIDLVTGTNVPVVNGKVTIAPKTAMVLKLASDIELAPKPFHVDFVNALAGNGYAGISWKTTSGGESYTIKRSETEDGEYEIIASGVTGNYYKDTTVQNGNVYYYKVAAVNENGEGPDSYRAKADLPAPVSGDTGTFWRDDRIGGTSGSAAIDGSSISIDAVGGTGLGEGDDSNIYKRDIKDSLHYVSRIASGNSSISAKIESSSGEASGIMMRDRLTSENARYIYFGADGNGNLVLQTRTRVSFHQWTNEVASPLNAKIEGYTVAEYPYVKLMRDHDSQTVYAFVSKDGTDWKYVTKMSTLLTYAYYIGVVSTDSAQFSEVTVVETPQGSLTPFVAKVQDQATLYWNKPKQASWFNLYRTTDAAAGQTDPVLKPGTAEPVDGSPWKLVLADSRATSYQEAGLRHGSVHYKILPVHGDGSPQPFYAASVSADQIEVVMEYAESLPASDYTKASFYLFHKELGRIKAEMAKPDADEDALINEIYYARNLLVPHTTSLYSFEGNADNTFGSSDGTVAGTPAYSAGKIGQAIELNGTDSYVALPPTHNLAASDQITVTTWVNWNGSSQWQRIFDFGSSTNQYMSLTPRSGNNTLRFAIKNGGGEQFVETSQFPVNQWVHVAVTLGSGTAKLYVNGELKAENKNVTIKPSDFKPSKNYIGKSQFADPLFSGRIDEFRVYNSVLSADEIIAIYNKTSTWFDNSLLTLLLDEAAAAVADHYTAESYEALQSSVANAKSVASSAIATQADVDAASADLLAALNGLEYVPGLPVLDPIGNKFVLAGERLAFTVQASNADNIVYGATGLPEGATFNAETRTFEWTPAKEQSGIYSVTFTVTSGDLSSSRTVKITVKGQPVIGPDTMVEATAKQLFTYQVAASDPSGASFTYSAANVPSGAWFDSANGILTWTPAQADYGSHPVTFTVSNGSFEASRTVDINVKLHVLPAGEYTKGSYYLYKNEVERIEAEMQKPEADKAKLAAQLDQAEKLLVHMSLYSFEGNANNAFGTTHGVVAGVPVYAEGKTGQAINLNGTDNFVTLPSSHPLSTSDFVTLSTWVYWKGGGNWQRIFDFGNNTSDYLFLTPRSGSNTLRFAIKNGGGEQIVETSQLPANQWVHVAVTLGTGTAKLYVNGQLKAENNKFTIKPSDFKPRVNYIGKSQWPDPLYNGMIDQFRIYNYVLNAEEIQAAMNSTATQWTDKTLIPVLLEEAGAADNELYKEESVQALQAEVTKAQSVYNKADAAQEEIDAAAASLLAALEGLQWKDITASLNAAEPNGKNGWYTSPVTLTLSPAKIAEYSLDGGTTWLAYSEPVILNKEGTNKVQYRRSVSTGETNSLEVKIDLTAPQVTVTGDTYYTIDQQIAITCNATDTVSGVTYSPCAVPLLQVKAYTLESGQHTVTATAEDEAGHQTTVTHTFAVTVTFDSLKTVTNAFLQQTGDKAWESVAKSYKQKLDLAKEKADSGKIEAAKGIMDGFIDQVRDHAGKFFTHEQAEILIRWAQIVV